MEFTSFLFDSETAVFSIGNAARARRAQPMDEPDSLERRNRLLLALNQVTMQMMDHRPVAALMQDIADLTLELTNASSSFCHIVKGAGSNATLELVAIAGKEIAKPGQRLQKGQGLAGMAWQHGRSEHVEDYQALPQRLQSIAGITQACALPMKTRNTVVGVLGIMYDDFRESIVDQLDLLQQFASLAAIAIENSVLMERIRNELVRNRIMNQLGNAAFETTDFDELLQITSRAVLHIIRAGGVDVWRVTGNGKLESLGGWQIAAGEMSQRHAADIERGRLEVSRWLAGNGTCKAVQNTVTDTALPQLIADPLRHGNCHTIACRSDKGIWAVLQVRLRKDSAFSENIRNVLESVATQFSIAAQRQRLQREVSYLAYHDSLTSLPNRIQFDLSLQAAVDKGAEHGMQFAVMFIDLDGFKQVNDTLGHDIGDRLLSEVARRLRHEMAEQSTLARIGGDEFAAIVWLQRDELEIPELAARLLVALGRRFRFDVHTPQVGASIGASIYPQHGREPSLLLRHADMAMYHAKQGGKNRCCLFETPSTVSAADDSHKAA